VHRSSRHNFSAAIAVSYGGQQLCHSSYDFFAAIAAAIACSNHVAAVDMTSLRNRCQSLLAATSPQ